MTANQWIIDQLVTLSNQQKIRWELSMDGEYYRCQVTPSMIVTMSCADRYQQNVLAIQLGDSFQRIFDGDGCDISFLRSYAQRDTGTPAFMCGIHEILTQIVVDIPSVVRSSYVGSVQGPDKNLHKVFYDTKRGYNALYKGLLYEARTMTILLELLQDTEEKGLKR